MLTEICTYIRPRLIKKESNGGMCQITCSTQTPDLNSAEMIWDTLDHKVKGKQSRDQHFCK